MVNLNDIISVINSEEIKNDKYNEIKEYLATEKGKNVYKFVNSFKDRISDKNFLYDECDHSIEDICLYYDNKLSEKEAEQVEINILKCDSCNAAYQSLREFSRYEVELIQEDKTTEKVENIINIQDKAQVSNPNPVLSNISTDNTKEKELSQSLFGTLLKKIKSSFDVFGSGFITGGLVAAALAVLVFLPQQNNILDNNDDNTTTHQTSVSQDLSSEEKINFDEGIKYYQDKDYEKSIDKLTSIINKKPDYYDAYWYIAKSFQAQNKKDEAKMYFNKYIEKTKDIKEELDLRINEAKNYE